MRAWLALAAMLLTASSAIAAPKGKRAKAAFQRGVAAYQKGDYAGASTAFGASFKAEADVETLFAWAQAERQQDNCDKASELYKKLLKFDLPTENKAAIQTKLEECQAIIAAKTPKPEPKPAPKPDPTPEPKPEPKPEPEPVVTQPEPSPEPVPEIRAQPEKPESGSSPWYKDPLGDILVLGGLGGLATGGVYLYLSRQDEKTASGPDYAQNPQWKSLQDRSEQRGKIGTAASIGGGVLLVFGLIRYATRSGGEDRTEVSGWITPDGGGVAAVGRF